MRSSSRRVAAALSSIVTVVLTTGLWNAAAAAPADAEAGSIRVVDSEDHPIEGAIVQLTPLAGAQTTIAAVTDAAGVLDLTTVPGFSGDRNPYSVWVSANGDTMPWTGPAGDGSVTIVGGGTEITYRALQPNAYPSGLTGTVAGTVTDAVTGAPVVGVQILISDVRPGGGDVPGGTQTRADGTYLGTYPGLILEGPGLANVEFVPMLTSPSAPYGYASQWWDDEPPWLPVPQTNLPIPPGTTSGIDAKLMPNGVVTGTVRQWSDGVLVPAVGATVSAWSTDGYVVADGYVDESGAYSMVAPVGDFIIGFAAADASAPAIYYDGATSRGDATSASVLPAAITSGIDAVLPAAVDAPSPGPGPAPVPAVALTGALQPGGTVSVQGSGLPSNTAVRVELHSTPSVLGTASTSATGAFALTATIPARTAPGAHALVVYAGDVELVRATVTISAAQLAESGTVGAAWFPATIGGFAIILVGGAMAALRRSAHRGDAV